MVDKQDRLFASRSFTFFWLGRVMVASAQQMLSVALAWQIWELTHSAFALGMVGLVQFTPRLFLMPLAGNLADRKSRRALLFFALSVQFLCMLALCLTTLTNVISVPVIYFITFVGGIGGTFGMPTAQAFLPQLVPTKMLSRAVAMSASAQQMSAIVAPAFAGFIYMTGPEIVYGLSAMMVLFSALTLLLVKPMHQQKIAPQNKSGWGKFVEGLKFIRQRRPVLGAITLDMMAVLLGGATALLPIVASEILHTGSWGLGLLRMAPALGALSMSLWLARYPLKGRVGRIMMISVAIFGVATIVFGLSSSLWLSMGSLVILGAADMVSMVFRSSYIQLATPDEMRGRVGAVNSLFIGASNQIGEFESGVTAAWFGTVPAIIVGGVGTLAVVVLWTRWFPELAKLEEMPVIDD